MSRTGSTYRTNGSPSKFKVVFTSGTHIFTAHATKITDRRYHASAAQNVDIKANGTITNVRVVRPSGTTEVDAIVVETVQKEWGYAPAIKRGKKVRCLLQQPFTIVLPAASPFHT